MADPGKQHPLLWSWRAVHWWGLAGAAQLFLALPMALAWHAWMNAALGSRYEPGELFANLSTAFRFDHRTELGQLASHNAGMGAALALLAMLLGMFLAGGWAAMAFGGRRDMRAAMQGASRFFGRYLRVWLWSLVSLAIWSWVIFGTPWRSGVLGLGAGLPEGDWDRMESFTSEWSAVSLRLGQGVLYALGVALVLAVGDYARLRVAWRNASFVTQEYFGAWWLVLSRPWSTLSPLALVALAEAGLVVIAGYGARSIEGLVGTNQSGLGGVATLAAISVLLLFLRCWCRGARYALAAGVVEREVGPLARPFAWRKAELTHKGY